ncbi:ATP-binding protein [Candidatus Bipolaricaulota bacterium]|nr:ATP-binding protein [Candidatus Bipolaricaulota bacterium]
MKYLKRAIREDIENYLKYFPVLLISGARQVGKSTLALHLGIDNYITLDDINMYQMAKNDPKGFIEHLEKPVIIDEVQRLPQLMITIKEYVDKDRINGEFILTGSASLSGFKDISDSLAGRIGIVELYPLSLKEKYGKEGNIIDIFAEDLDSFLLQKYDNSSIVQNIIEGGYPEILKIDNTKAKYLWFSSYIRTYIESDAKELANIRNMDKFMNMYRLCMLRSGNIFNQNELQKECGLDNKTFSSYFSVLEHTYQLQKLQPFFKNELKRLVKSPKIFAIDTGVLCHLLRIASKEEYETSHYKGDILETFVYAELLKANTYANNRTALSYYRTSDKKEIDFILEFSNGIVAIEVKASKSVSKSDFKHMYHLAKEIPDTFSKGIVLYNGESFLKIDKDMYAVPFGFLI